MKLDKLFGERILIDITKEVMTKTEGGLIIPQSVDQEKTNDGIVVKIGTGVKIPINIGDKVLYDKYAGAFIKDEDKEYLIVWEKDILSTII